MNLWSWFRGADRPFYDPGLGYSVPYTVYSSGVGWRDDLVASTDAPDARDPFAILWNDRYRGRLGVYDAYLEALSLALIRDGVVDLKAATDADLERAADALEEAVRVADLRFTIDGAEEGLPEGEFIAHQAWSGDVLAAPRYADRYEPGRGPASPESSATVCRRVRPRRGLRPDGGLRERTEPRARACVRQPPPRLRHGDGQLRGTGTGLRGATEDAFADPSFRWHGAVPPTFETRSSRRKRSRRARCSSGSGPPSRRGGSISGTEWCH